MKSFEPFRLDFLNQCLWRGETRVPLMPKPFAVLRYLVDHPGRLITYDELLGAVWPDTFVQPEILRRYILEIRRALGDDAEAPTFIQTFPKRGYQFMVPVIDDEAAGAERTAPGVSSALVGRKQVLADLQRFLTAALTGRRQIVFLIGEPGIGKTSIVDAFQRTSAASGVAAIRGQSFEGFGGKEAYYPLLEAFGQLAQGTHRALLVNTLTAVAPTWLIQFPSLVRPEQQVSLQREIVGATRERMVRELCEALEVITRTVPLVVVLEDLHWVDHSTLDVLSALARRREPARLLLVGTFRPADLILIDSPLKTLKQDLVVHRLSHELELEQLEQADVAAYLAAEFTPGDLPADLASLIHRHSDGNPLFMTAMLDHLVRRRILAQSDGRWRVTVPLEEVDPGVPETLKQMLEMQMQHLSEAEQQVLKCASVAGQRFSAWAIGAMQGSDVSIVESMCDALADRQQFLRASGSRELPDGTVTTEYQFRHALYRDVLYRRLNPTVRLTFHRRLAEGLERLTTPVEPELAAQIASHFEESHEFERVIRYLILTAQNATRRYSHRQAIEVLEHAQGILPKVRGDRISLEFQLLERIGNAYYALGDMERSAATYETMAARAAEAGLLAAQAEALMRAGHPAESIPFFLRAVELDPGLAVVYTALSRIYSNIGEIDRANEYARLAYERRAQASERDRLSITYQYHFEVTGDQTLATETLEIWKRSFPGEFQPVNSLTLVHNFLGRFERAIEEGEEAVRRNPSHGYPYSNLAHAYRGAGRLDDAQRTADRAVELEVETLPTRRLLYQLAVMDGDDASAMRHFAWARGKPREFDMIGARAQASGWFGRLREARELYKDVDRAAALRSLPEAGTNHLAWAASMELTFGCTDQARDLARRVLDRAPSYDGSLRAAFVLAMTGSVDDAQRVVNRLTAAHPDHTFINFLLAPIVRAAIELGREQPDRALEQLKPVERYELGFLAAFAPIYLRGQAYLMLGAGQEAAGEFQRVRDHRGTDPFSPFHAVAALGIARGCALAGDLEGSREAYEQFFAAWAHADPDIPILINGREEYGRLAAGTKPPVTSPISGR